MEKMHQTAEYGIAAHWKYKEGIKGKKRARKSLPGSEAPWNPSRIPTHRTFSRCSRWICSPMRFFRTPRGDVVNLPAKATPIDFAYSIHSAIGNSMSGATVNGRIVPFNQSRKTVIL